MCMKKVGVRGEEGVHLDANACFKNSTCIGDVSAEAPRCVIQHCFVRELERFLRVDTAITQTFATRAEHLHVVIPGVFDLRY